MVMDSLSNTTAAITTNIKSVKKFIVKSRDNERVKLTAGGKSLAEWKSQEVS